MREARELMGKVATVLDESSRKFARNRDPNLQRAALALSGVSAAITGALADQEPEKVPELPEWLRRLKDDTLYTTLPSSGTPYWFTEDLDAADLERIAEGWTILAARRRAGL